MKKIDFNSAGICEHKVLDSCIGTIRDQALKGKWCSARENIIGEYEKYKDESLSGNSLHNISNKNFSFAIVEAKKHQLYNQLTNTKEPKKIYYKLRSLAEINKCPYCGFGEVSALDHYLPKSHYPYYQIYPMNLIGSCDRCNRCKGDALASSYTDLVLHPYIDDSKFYDEQWLSASFEVESGKSYRDGVMVYSVQAPQHWPGEDRVRIENHFNTFQLAERYNVRAAGELNDVRESSIDELKPCLYSLEDRITSYNYSKGVNSWKSIFYRSLKEFYYP